MTDKNVQVFQKAIREVISNSDIASGVIRILYSKTKHLCMPGEQYVIRLERNGNDFHAWGEVMICKHHPKNDYAIVLEHTWTNVCGVKDGRLVQIFEFSAANLAQAEQAVCEYPDEDRNMTVGNLMDGFVSLLLPALAPEGAIMC